MNRHREYALSLFGNRPVRRPRLLLESLESRRLLSATSTTTITPDVTTITADFERGHGFGGSGGGITNPTPASTALTPSQLAAAYSMSLASTTGSGQTIAIVDAYNDPNIQADLAVFDSEYKLPTANLTVENQSGQTSNLPQTDPGWSLEIALDVEWAHAAAPGAKIVLVEANSASISDLMAGVQTAAKQANVVSMSWGGSEFQGETAYDTTAYFANPNVTFIAASGDSGGATGAQWPAASPYVVSVGGTTLSLSSSGATLSETAWSASGSFFTGTSGSGGGVSLYEPAPRSQAIALGSSVTKRETPDVASDANPSTGLSVYDSIPGLGPTGWFQVGGTSAGVPVWAGIAAAADQARAAVGVSALNSTSTLSLLYGISSSAAYASDFHDITSGSNFVATAKVGYDMVTGLGSPVASNLIAAATPTVTTTTTTTVAKSSVATTTTTTTTTTTSTTHGTAHDQAVAASPTATLAANTAVAVFLTAGPVTTTSTASQSLATSETVSASATDALATATATAATARPNQPLAQPAPVVLSSLGDGTVEPPAPEIPSGPGLFLDPVEIPEIGDEGPALVTAPTAPDPHWDAALEAILAEEGWMPEPVLTPPQAPVEDLGTDELTSASPIALAGLAVALWGTRELRRRSERNPRRWPDGRDSNDTWPL